MLDQNSYIARVQQQDSSMSQSDIASQDGMKFTGIPQQDPIKHAYGDNGFSKTKPHLQSPWKAYSTVIGGFIYMLMPGTLYCTGVFQTYIQSYFKVSADKTIVQDLLPACLFFNMLFMPFGSYLAQKNVNPRLLIVVGAIVAFPCWFLCSVVDEFWAFACFYILAFSFNQGIVYMVPVHHGWLWFPENPGLVSGIILGGFGAGALVFDNVFTHMINPHNVPYVDGHYNEHVDNRFVSTWRQMLLMWLGIAFVGFLMTFPGPVPKKRLGGSVQAGTPGAAAGDYDYSERKALMNEKEYDMTISKELDNLKVTSDDVPMVRMIFSQQFIVIYIMNMFSVITGFFAVNNFKPYGILNGLNDENYLAWLGSAASVCNSIRFVWSLLTDYFDYKIIYGIMLVIQIVFNCTVPLVNQSEALYGIWISMLLFCEGGHFTLVPNVLKKIYGSDKGTALYGIAFSYSGICSILIVIMQTTLLTEDPKSYDIFFYCNAAASGISLLLLLTLFKEDKFKTQ